ncbi:MAG: right-handed parallel beta-helix repeat-containing protein, partial [Bacteroidales bacterium]|nr:right-handed parallel beta-helix repeat-containing protein [Bacteroidales bacterium]
FYVYNGTATLTNTNIEFFYYYGAEVNDVFNMTGGLIDMTGYHSSYGHGLYARDGSVCTLNNMNIINSKYGINLTTTSQAGLTDCTVTSNEWPVYYGGPGALTVSGTCDFTGNTRDAFYVAHYSNSNAWTLPSINDNIVLVEDYVPYYFYNSYTVNNGGSLIIGSDNVVKFRLYCVLDIRGTLTANAGVGKNIYFTSERDDNWGGDTNNDGTSTSPATGNWYGIRFYDESNDASVMRRCMLRYAGYGSLGGVTLYDASPVIDYCDFSHNYFGVYLQYTSSPTFTNNTIGSSSMTPIAMSFEANPTFTNNVLSFSENQYDAIGLIGGTLSSNAHIIQRDFTTVNNITYLMLAQITVPSGFTLTIDPGIVIKSTSYSYRIIIEGKLDAVGTGADFITFTSAKDDTHGNPGDTNRDGAITSPSIGDMGAIIFEDGSDPTSIMDYVRMKYARVYNYYYPNGGQNHYLNSCAVATINANPTISNCEFRELDYGVSCYTTSNPVISNNAMINISNTPFSISASANPAFSGNTYTNIGMNAIGLLGHNIVVNSSIIKRTVAGFTNITYVLLEDIEILNGANLDIAPGVVIKIVSKGWDIQGGFKCNGTVTEHVVFTSLYDDNVGNPMDTNGDGNATTPSWGNWYDISFEENSDDSYCDLVYTDLQYGGYYYNGIVTTTNASPKLNNVLIDQSYYYGLWFNGNSAPVVNNVDINNCRLDPIAISLTSNPIFSGITFSANGSNGIKIIEGTLSSNSTLIKRNIAGFTNIAYIIDDLNIAAGAILTLEEGIIIKFDGSYFKGIFIHGGLNATGTVSENIIFTSIKDDSAGGDTNNDGGATVPVNSDWHGLVYYPEGDDNENKLIYCEIRYTGGGYSAYLGSNTYNGSVRMKDDSVTIEHTVFQQSSQTALGIYGSAHPKISDCQMYNINYEPVYMALFSNPTFSNNTIGNAGRIAIGIQPETYSQNATVPQRTFAGYSNITYFFYDATINSGTTITIPAGTVFKSSSGANFTVNGTLEVNGAVGDSVIFTDYRDDDYGNPLDTEDNGSGSTPTSYGPYFVFNDVSNDASFINYAVIRYSGNTIQLNNASPSITNNTFYKVDYGITNSGVCAPVVDNNTFDNLDFAPMLISLVSYPSSTSGNLISGTTYKGIAVNNETLTMDATLSKRSFGGITNIPYIFSGYTIGTGVTLTVDPGVVSKFTQGGWMTVNNGLIAEGLAASDMNIVFTSLTDDFYGGDTNADSTYTSYGSNTWYGITFNSVALDPLCRFENCIFRFAKYSTGYAIKTINASPSILNCSFNNNNYGVYATGASDPTVNYCDFFDNYYMAVNNVGGSFIIDAENCWWGDNSGPTHSGNPGGTGEEVSDEVDYDPYGTSGAINP